MKGVKATEWVSVLAPGDGDPRHGLNGYSNLGCRCDICRKANATRQYEARQARRTKPLPEGVEHGTYNAYSNYRCKCPSCRAANTAYARGYQRRRQAAS